MYIILYCICRVLAYSIFLIKLSEMVLPHISYSLERVGLARYSSLIDLNCNPRGGKLKSTLSPQMIINYYIWRIIKGTVSRDFGVLFLGFHWIP
jgi:hypothetical protein